MSNAQRMKWLWFATIVVMLAGVSAYSSGARQESCYSMLTNLTNTTGQDVIPPIACNSSSVVCDGITLTVTQNGNSDVYYRCDEYYEGLLI